MIIEKIKIKNFKSHKDTQINFNQGITVILGENGAGKSTILEAISYTLFKKFDGKIDDLIRKTTDDEDYVDKMEIVLEFSHAGNNYRITRGKNKSKNIAQLDKKNNDGKYSILSAGDKNVTTDVKNILSIDPESFLNAIYIKQGEITNLIDKTASEKKQFISKLLNIDSLEKAWSEIKNIIDIYEDQKNIKIGQMQANENLSTEHDEKIAEIDKITLDLNTKTKEKDETLSKLEKIKEDLKNIEEDKTKHNDLNNHLNQNQQLLKDEEKRKEEHEMELVRINKFEEEIVKLEEDIKPLDKLKEFKEYNTEYLTLTKDFNRIEKEIQDIKKVEKDKNDTLSDYERYETLEKEKEALENKKQELTEKDKKFIAEATKLNTKRKEKEEILNYVRSNVSNANEILQTNISSLDELKEVLTSKNDVLESEIENIHEKISKNENNISSLKSKNETSKKSLNDLKKVEDKCPICQSDISHEKHESLSKQYQDEINNNTIKIKDIEEELERFNNKLSELEEELKVIKSINIEKVEERYAKFDELKREIKSLEDKTKDKEENDNALNKLTSQLNECNDELKSLKDNHQKHIISINILKNQDITSKEKDKAVVEEKINSIHVKLEQIREENDIGENIDLEISNLEDKKGRYHNLQGTIKSKKDIIQKIEYSSDKISTFKEEINKTNKEILELSFDDNKYEEINNRYTCYDDKTRKYALEIKEYETNLKRYNEELEKLEIKIKENEAIKEELEHLEEYIKILKSIRELYSKDGIQKDLRKNTIPQIRNNTLEIFNEFDFDYSSINLDEDYNITIETGMETLTLNMLSGGEKIVIALALRLGIAKVVTQNKTELLILDEPTIHLDEERRSNLIEIIRKINIVPQMIVVTHDDEMLSLSNNIINIRKSNGVSYKE